jgi:hypothetical protein
VSRFQPPPGDLTDPEVPAPRAIGGADRAAGICWDGWTTDPEVPTYGVREAEENDPGNHPADRPPGTSGSWGEA